MKKDQFIKLVNENLNPYYNAEFMHFNEKISHCEVIIRNSLGYVQCLLQVDYEQKALCVFNGCVIGSIKSLVDCYMTLNGLMENK